MQKLFVLLEGSTGGGDGTAVKPPMVLAIRVNIPRVAEEEGGTWCSGMLGSDLMICGTKGGTREVGFPALELYKIGATTYIY